MSTTAITPAAKRPAPPRYQHILTPGFAATPGAELPVDIHTAPFPHGLLPRLERAWNSNPDARSQYLPTFALRELVECLEPCVASVDGNLEADAWLHALQRPHDELPLLLALEAWITTQVAPHQTDVDWYNLIKNALPLQWTTQTVDLLARGERPNGTARPRDHVYALLATYLTSQLIEDDFRLPGQKEAENLVLGPVDGRGRRSIYQWPPRELTDDDDAHGLWTHQTAFRVVTMPHDSRLLLRVTPHITRFGSKPAAYIPRRASHGPSSATVFLHAPQGVLRSTEKPLLMRAPVTVTGRMHDMQWRWAPGLARALPALPSRHLFPDPDRLRTEPHAYTSQRRTAQEPTELQALLLHAAGYTYLAPDPDPTAIQSADSAKPRRRTLGHPADTGLQPVDHLLLFEQLQGPLKTHFTPLERIPKISQRRPPRLQVAVPDATFQLELLHAAPLTHQAVHLALTGHLGYEHLGEHTEGHTVLHRYRGDSEIHLRLLNPGTLTAGLPQPPQGTRGERSAYRRHQRDVRANALREQLPEVSDLTGAIVEIDKPVTFAAAGQDDPKQLLKNTLPALSRHVQCMHPVTRTANPEAKMEGAKPYKGTQVRCDDVERAASAVRDILRSVGHLPKLPAPRKDLASFELTAVHLARSRGGLVPMVLRMDTSGTVTGQLISTWGQPEAPMPLVRLPRALTEGRGRIPHRDRAQLKDFLIQAIAPDSHADRLLLVRAQTLRSQDIWPWLQNDHITPDLLLPPGQDVTSAAPTARRTPEQLPGLRIVRLNDDSSEIPLAFGANHPAADQAADGEQPTEHQHAEHPQDDSAAEPGSLDGLLPYEWGRYSGVVPWNARTFLAINPRPDTHQLPKGVSKYLGDNQNAARHGANPTSLEIHISFCQPGDDPTELASYVNNLRRCHLHTATPTRLPLLLHLSRLMEEYID